MKKNSITAVLRKGKRRRKKSTFDIEKYRKKRHYGNDYSFSDSSKLKPKASRSRSHSKSRHTPTHNSAFKRKATPSNGEIENSDDASFSIKQSSFRLDSQDHLSHNLTEAGERNNIRSPDSVLSKFPSINVNKSGKRRFYKRLPESVDLSTPSLKTYFAKQISPDNLRELLKVTGKLPTKEELDEWIVEFKKEGLFTEEELIKAFRLYDEDDGGTITRNEIKKIIDLIGEDISDSEIEELIREADIDGDGEIDYIEFVKLILAENAQEKF